MRFVEYPKALSNTLLMGSYPEIFQQRLIEPRRWYDSYIRTYVERDVRALKNIGDLSRFHDFLKQCALRPSQLVNFSSLARDCDITQPTAKAWFRLLEASYIVFRLPVFRTNVRKQMVKSPKLYFYDTGLLCHLLDIASPEDLAKDRLRGAIFETWVVSEVAKMQISKGYSHKMWFLRDHKGVEVDLIVKTSSQKYVALEVKSSVKHRIYRIKQSTQNVLQKLGISETPTIIHGGDGDTRKEDCDRLVSWDKVHELSL